MVNDGKRSTRSQANISDYFSKVPLDLSPLKQARSAMRNADAIVATDSPGVGSSTGVTSGKKRSASSPSIDREGSVERELKRSKTSADENEAHEPSSLRWKLQAFLPPSNPLVLPPPSISGSTTPTKSIGPSPRARSVPPSIPTTPGHVPHLDLSKYRSPTKSAHRVRVMSVPPSSPPLRDREMGEGGAGIGMAVGRDLDRTPVPRMVVEKVEKVRRNLHHPPPALVGSQHDDPFSLESDALPKTPVQKTRSLLESMSPLTPLGSLDSYNQPLPSTLSLPPINPAIPDPTNVDLPVPSPQPQPRLTIPSESKPEPRPDLTKRSSHLIPPQPRPLSFRLPSRSPSPPSQWVPRPRSVSVDLPIPALPHPLVPSTSNTSNGPAPEPEPVPLVSPTMADPQPPEKHDSPEPTPSTTPPMTTEPIAPAPALVLPPVPDTVEHDENGKGKTVEQVPKPSKLPAKKSIKASTFRFTTPKAGPSGVTRTRATKATVRSTPMSREGRVTRSSTAKSRQADLLKEQEMAPVTKPEGGGGEKGEVEKEKEGKDSTSIGIRVVRSTLVLERETDTGFHFLSVFIDAAYAKATKVDGFCFTYR